MSKTINLIQAVNVSTRRSEGEVEVRVSDNGPGIPTGSGTELGLSLSYDIVTQGHGGALAVESEEGKGATFVVTLPLNKTE